MAKWQVVIAIVVLMLSGCSTDPKTNRLQLAQTGVIEGPQAGTVTAYPAVGHSPNEINTANRPTTTLKVGQRVMIKIDDGSEGDNERLVRVMVWEGPHKGQLIDVRREDLRLVATTVTTATTAKAK
jgi:hypothetical protein